MEFKDYFKAMNTKTREIKLFNSAIARTDFVKNNIEWVYKL